jgi:cell division protein ZapA (FtsZ GTPase activity inhibitor)
MTKKHVPIPDVPVFVKFLDRGFNLSVPADQEIYYREGYKAFMQRVEEHKSEEQGGGYDDIEAIGLTAVDFMVALQKALEQMKEMMEAFHERIAKLDVVVSEAIDG